MSPSCMQLQNLSQKSSEYFKKYAQMLRKLASRVQPPFLDRELVNIFMDTLQGYYLEKMIGSVSSSFSSMVIVGEHIESGLKSRKIQDALRSHIDGK